MEEKLYYSKSTNGFYSTLINSNIPEDAVEITKEEHTALLEGQSNGNRIIVNADGKPKLANKLPQTLEELKAQKIFEFERIKDKAQLEPVKVRDLFFFGGRENAQKYKEAFDLAKMMGKTSGVFAHTEGFVEVDEDFAKEVIIAVGASVYNAWYKFRQLETIVNSAKTKRELDKIKWED